MVWIPLAVVLTAAVGWAACAALGWNVHVLHLLIAAAAAVAAGELAVLPLGLARHSDQAGVSQAALGGTMIHLLVLATAAGAVCLTSRTPLAFLYWLGAFYAATLVTLVAAFSRSIRAAPAQPRTAGTLGTGQQSPPGSTQSD